MYNIRYHIASLVSVFLALALGLVLGGLIVDKTSTGSQNSLVTGLKQEFTTLRSENSALQEDVSAYGAFSDDMTAKYLSKMLENKTVAILGYNNKAMEIAHDDVAAMGGKAVLVDIDGTKLDMKNANLKSTQMITELMTKLNLTNANDAIAAALEKEWVIGETKHPLTDVLSEEGVLDISDFAKFKGVDGVVDTAIDGDKVSSLGIKIAAAFKVQKRPSLCASMFHGNSVLATKGWKQGVTSTNMLSTSIGTYTIGAIMNGAEAGLYGTIDAAKDVFPKMN